MCTNYNAEVSSKLIKLLFLLFLFLFLLLLYYLWGMVKTATNQNGDTPKWRHQNGDRLS